MKCAGAVLILDCTALAAALKEHGFTPYDFPDRFRNGHLPDWDKAMRAKFYGIGKPLGRDELDQLTGDFDVLLLALLRTGPSADSRLVCPRHAMLLFR